MATTTPPVPVGGERLTGGAPVYDVPAGVPAPPQLAAASYLLADATTGAVLVAQNPHGRALPASTLKMLTALTVIPLLSPAEHYTAVPGDLVEGTKVGMSPGSSYSVQQLLQGMMLSSGNDAATGLARVAGGVGGVEQTVAAMQQNAIGLGALDTVVKDPSGLDAPGQVTSAYDLALIARAALRLPAFDALVATRHVRFPGRAEVGKVRTSYEIQNHNSLLFNYPGAVGVKNGYTVAARWTIVGAATRGGRTYVVTALARADRSWRPTAAMLDWAFAHGTQARPIGHLVEPGEVTSAGATSHGLTASSGGVVVEPSVPVTVGGALDRRSASILAGPVPGTQWARWIGAGGLASAFLVVGLLALSAHARQRQLRAARAARSARPARR
ncbi:MAG: D-alanyl-D-alanine carboxypeptidase [Rhodoferax sp.]|nr:D-alanyl-D-alanine carboxypeptidase [Actinomycetota bacterium]